MTRAFKLFFFNFLITTNIIYSQNVGINTTGATPAATNMLEVLNPSTTDNSVAIYGAHTGIVAGTGYGIWSEVTGASTTNVAGYFSASGATNNYAIIVPAGRVGLGTTSPTVRLDVVGSTKISSDLFVGVNETTGNRLIEIGTGRTGDGATALDFVTDAATYTDYGMRLIRSSGANGQTSLLHRGTGDILFMTEEAASIRFATTSVDRMTITSAGNVGIGTSPTATNLLHVSSTSTTASSVGLFLSHSGAISGTGYGIWAEKTGASTTNIAAYYSASGATNNYAIIVPSGGGNVGIGTTTPSSKAILDLTSTTQGVLVPRMTKAQRDAIVSPATSLLVFVTDGTPIGFYYYTGTAWVPLVSTVTNTTTSPTALVYQGQTIMVHTSDSPDLAWDNTAYGATGATSSTNGQTNIATLTAIDITKFPAAYYCDTLTAYGYTDWYLPSSNEMLYLCQNTLSLVGLSAANQYWASTETDATQAHRYQPGIIVSAGNRVYGGTLTTTIAKTGTLKCRCIRKP